VSFRYQFGLNPERAMIGGRYLHESLARIVAPDDGETLTLAKHPTRRSAIGDHRRRVAREVQSRVATTFPFLISKRRRHRWQTFRASHLSDAKFANRG